MVRSSWWILLLVVTRFLRSCQSFQVASPLAVQYHTISNVPNLLHHSAMSPQFKSYRTSNQSPQSTTSTLHLLKRRLRHENNNINRKNFMGNSRPWWGSFLTKNKKQWMYQWRAFRKRLVSVALSLMLILSLHVVGMAAADAAVKSGYRSGGSFKSSSSTSHSRPAPRYHHQRNSNHRLYSSSSRQQQLHLSPTVTRMTGPRISIHHHNHHSSLPFYVRSDPRIATTFSPADILVLTGTGTLLAYGFVNHRRNEDPWKDKSTIGYGPLGPGATATAVTVSVNIPDRDDPNNLLNRLQAIAEKTDTSRREGIQELIGEASLELLRGEESITSMLVKSKHHSDPDDALKDFNAQSIESRSKYDREIVDRYGGKSVMRIEESRNSNNKLRSPRATVAVVTLNLAIDGDSTFLPKVKTRQQLVEALRCIALDARVEDCLFAAEVIWIPGDRDDNLTRDDVYAAYPNLLLV